MADRWIVSDHPREAAARLVAEAIRTVDREHGFARLAIPGGSAIDVIRLLPSMLTGGEWSRLRLTWVDERCVPVASPDSNRGAAHAAGLYASGPVALELPLLDDSDTPETAVDRFSRRFQEHFQGGLDIALLGVGEDGHIASLFPGRRWLASKAPIFHVSDSPKPPPRRMTMTYDVLRLAGHRVLFAAGAGKRAALEAIKAGRPDLPVNILGGDRLIVTDQRLEGTV